MNRELAKYIRQTYKMTTFEFAEMIGVSLSSYSNYECGYSSSDLVPKKIVEHIPNEVITEADKLLRLSNAVKGVKAI